MSSFDSFVRAPIKIFKYLAIDFSKESHKRFTLMQIATVINTVFVITLQILYIYINNDDNENAKNMSYINYYLTGLGKFIALIFNRVVWLKCVEQLKEMFPTKFIERKYRLQHYLKHYIWFERFIWNFFLFLCFAFLPIPLLQSLIWLKQHNEFPFEIPIAIWIPKKLEGSVLAYIAAYMLGCICSIQLGTCNAGCDLCLISCISQLCLHFDLLSQQIMELQPGENENKALENLKAIAKRHSKLRKLANKINTIFGPSILFSLISSSFILCFVAYQMLDDIPMILLLKAFVILIFESKQVIIICYFGNKLMESSSLINQALYSHNWFEGSIKYKRQVLYMLMHTSKPFTLNVLKLTDINLVTLKEVYGNAYQLFTVFKSN